MDRPFKSLFASLFKSSGEESAISVGLQANSINTRTGTGIPDSAIAVPGPKEEPPNPFTEAKEKATAVTAAAEMAPAPPAKPVAAAHDDPPAKPTDPPKPSVSDTTPTPAPIPLTVTTEARFVFLGDFDESGTLKAAGAERSDDGSFAFSDGKRTFSLYVNPSVIDGQRSFGVEDLNGDGIADMLVTSRPALYGGVLYGKSDGTFTVADSFLTGFEPTVAVAGPAFEGQRDILAVNVRTGGVTAFRASERYRRVRDQALMDFLPEFIAHLVETASGLDCVLAAQTGKPARVYRWREDSSLYSAEMTIHSGPAISLSRDFLRDNLMSTVNAYQVGPYASITLTNSKQQSFNVANMRVMPRIFLAVGNLTNRGSLDVAVAYLLSTVK